jgi:hypothetical protein
MFKNALFEDGRRKVIMTRTSSSRIGSWRKGERRIASTVVRYIVRKRRRGTKCRKIVLQKKRVHGQFGADQSLTSQKSLNSDLLNKFKW